MAELKDTTITRTDTHRLTADIFGPNASRTIAIHLDGELVDQLNEYQEQWFHNLEKNKHLTKLPSIGSTPEEALAWWIKKQGFTEAE